MRSSPTRVFLSYSGRSSDFAPSIAGALEACDCTVFDYWESHSTEPTAYQKDLDRFREGAQYADLIVQLIEEDLGGFLDQCGRFILPQELKWYVDSCQGGHKPPPFVVSIKNAALPQATAEYLDELAQQGIHAHLETSRKNATHTIVQWIRSFREPPGPTIVSGVLDTTLSRSTIDHELRAAIQNDTVFPQKFLYTSPVGGMLWKQLAKGSYIGQVWKLIPFREPSEPIPAQILETLKGRRTISVIALGCGDGAREAVITERLVEWSGALHADVILVDVSKTLIAEACGSFRDQVRGAELALRFALIDFEWSDSLLKIRSQLPHDVPAVTLVLGNTLGNIPITSFVRRMSSALRPGDLLVLEVLFASVADRRIVENDMHRSRIPIPNDERFEFITNPIRYFGLSPSRQKLGYYVEDTPFGYRRTFDYIFDRQDQKYVDDTIFSGSIRKGNRLRLLSIESVEETRLVEFLAEEGFHVDTHAVQTVEGPPRGDTPGVCMGYIVAVKS